MVCDYRPFHSPLLSRGFGRMLFGSCVRTPYPHLHHIHPSPHRCEEHSGAQFSFTIVLPRHEAPKDEVERPSSPVPALPESLRVLVADDLLLNRKLLKLALTRSCGANWQIDIAATAEEALQRATVPADGAPLPDLLIMDEIFSDDESAMRGSEAIKRIRAANGEAAGGGAAESGGSDGADGKGGKGRGQGRKRLLIISCTGNAAYDLERLRECGADDVWSKPFPSFTDGSMQKRIGRMLEAAAW